MENIKNLKSSSDEQRIKKYADSAFFKKKDADAIAFLKKHPIPKDFIKQDK
jgi:hypothetical protein